MFKLTTISTIILTTTAINIAVSYISWQKSKTKSGLYFSLGMTAITFWTLTAGLGYAAVPLALKILFAKLDAVGYNSALFFFLLFGLYYANLDEWIEKKWTMGILSLVPISSVLLIVTNNLHEWVWTGYSPVKGNIVIFEHGPGFIWVELTGYLMILFLIGVLWLTSSKGSEFSRRQGRLMLFACIFPLAANLVYLFGVKGAEGIDWSSVTFSITGLFILRAVYGQRLLDITPIARAKLIQNLSDGMIVLDMQDRIIDINQVATNIMETQPAEVLGKNLLNVVPLSRTFLEQSLEHEVKSEFETGLEKKRYYDLLISPLREGPVRIIGRLIIFRDITKRKENELHLIQLTQDLQETQSLLVKQQRTLAALEERQRMGRDMHDSVNQSIHSLMLFSETLVALLEKKQTQKAIAVAQRIHESGAQALKEIRLLLYETQSVLADKNTNLVDVLKERLNMVERRVGIDAEIIYDAESMVNYPSEWNENLYWIVIEALNNTLKHAQARSVKISIRVTEKQMEMKIEDNGTGFDISRTQSGGLGTSTMRERAELLGGQLSIDSASGQGTSVHFKTQLEI